MNCVSYHHDSHDYRITPPCFVKGLVAGKNKKSQADHEAGIFIRHFSDYFQLLYPHQAFQGAARRGIGSEVAAGIGGGLKRQIKTVSR